MNISRREAVIKMAVLLGASVVGPRLLAGTFGQSGALPAGYTADDLALLDEIGDTIIPADDVPGAKAVGIGAFVAMMVNDCYDAPDQRAFRLGLAKLAVDFQAQYGAGFMAGRAEDRTAFLNKLDHDQRAQPRTRNRRRPGNGEEPGADTESNTAGLPQAPDRIVPFFRMMKELTILGYFTSEIGCTQALRYAEVPGGFDGNAPYKQGDRAWAT